MDRNIPKNGLVNLAVAIIIFIAVFAVTCLVNSLAGEGASIFLFITVLVAFASWFQMRLEDNERIEKLEHITAAHIEQARLDYEENRRLWREQQAEIAAIWKRMEERDREWTRRMEDRDEEWQRRMIEMDREMTERDRTMDKRIGELVTAIGELIRRMDGKAAS